MFLPTIIIKTNKHVPFSGAAVKLSKENLKWTINLKFFSSLGPLFSCQRFISCAIFMGGCVTFIGFPCRKLLKLISDIYNVVLQSGESCSTLIRNNGIALNCELFTTSIGRMKKIPDQNCIGRNYFSLDKLLIVHCIAVLLLKTCCHESIW